VAAGEVGGDRGVWGGGDGGSSACRPRRHVPTAVGATATAVEHSGRILRGPLPAADRWQPPYRRGARRLDVLPPWPTAAAVVHGGWLPNLINFQIVT
jgi:hypothetical protein